MPVIIQNDGNVVNTTKTKTYKPTFFDKILNGQNGQSGLLSHMVNPVKRANGYIVGKKNMTHVSYHNGVVKIIEIPVGILDHNAQHLCPSVLLERKYVISAGDFVIKDNSHYASSVEYTGNIYLDITIDRAKVEIEPSKTQQGGNTDIKKIDAAFKFNLYFILKDNDDTSKEILECDKVYKLDAGNVGTTLWGKFSRNKNVCFSLDTENIYETMKDVVANINTNIINYNKKNKINWRSSDIMKYLDSYSLYDGFCRQSEAYHTHVADILIATIRNAKDKLQANDDEWGYAIKATLNHLEQYKVPLDEYKKLYDGIQDIFSDPDYCGIDSAKFIAGLCKSNLNLLLNSTMTQLQEKKQMQTSPFAGMFTKQVPSVFSNEQALAIRSEEQYILTSAGAGTGKSTTIKGRVNYMIDCGVAPEDITVLSFTNAGADRIKELMPTIHSQTIASMIHTIYSANMPDHELSSLKTLYNSIQIYFGNAMNDDLLLFRKRIRSVIQSEEGSYTNLNNFVEDHIDFVLDTLNTIGQTSLELEALICYHLIDNLVEPDSIKLKHLIVDEVQDNSIFEFIYLMQFVANHDASMFMVGDPAQCLYEFRASNPRAINVLHQSGVFGNFNLEINYRSNQEILDFANVLLADIEANKSAGIQLQSNNLAKVTKSTFTDKVNMDYIQVKKYSDINASVIVPGLAKAFPWIDSKKQAGQQVAFLAFKRSEIEEIENNLNKLWPGCKIVNIVPEKHYSITIFSDFIAHYWDMISFAPPQNILSTIQGVYNQVAPRMTYASNVNKLIASAGKQFGEFNAEHGADIQSYMAQAQTGQISNDEMLDCVKQLMLKFEIKKNAIKSHLIAEANNEKKNADISDADFIISTIHSAKGLEFDNTVVLVRATNQMDEEDKRMYYVALTRAKEAEYVIGYEKIAKPRMLANYTKLIKSLPDN